MTDLYRLVAHARPVGAMQQLDGRPAPGPTNPAEAGPPCDAYDAAHGKLTPAGVDAHGRPISRCRECTRSQCWIGMRRLTPQKRPRGPRPSDRRWQPQGECCATCQHCDQVATVGIRVQYTRRCEWVKSAKHSITVGFYQACRSRGMACAGQGFTARI